MTRPLSDFRRVKALVDSGVSQAAAARMTGLPRSTIREWLERGPCRTAARSSAFCPPCPNVERAAELPAYAYLLGLYLGDGYISGHPRGVYRMRITLDARYPGIISDCTRAMEGVLPNTVTALARAGCVEVRSYSKHWPCLFPQHGAGPKHTRRIRLEPWQERAAFELHPGLLLRGLVHSDGWRGTNVAVTPSGRYRYTRYNFSNRSSGIQAIFAEACARLGVETRQMNRWNVSVSRRADVAVLDRFIGPKR